jgi:hypothetical protein
MAQRVGGPWLKVGKLIELFTAMGCTLGELPGGLHGPDRHWRVRFLYSAETDDFVSLSDLEDDDASERGRELGKALRNYHSQGGEPLIALPSYLSLA